MKSLKLLAVFSVLVGGGLLAHAQPAQISVSCSKIPDATERLACFDRTFPNVDGATANRTVLPAQSVAPEVASEPVGSERVGSERVGSERVAAEGESDTSGSSQAQVDKDKRGLLPKSPFGRREDVTISSRIKSVRDKDQQKMVFLLENDQIWLQNSPRSLPFKEGDDITIKSATVGGYILSSNNGVSTRVRRIK